jgi:hypothetical protein
MFTNGYKSLQEPSLLNVSRKYISLCELKWQKEHTAYDHLIINDSVRLS